MQIGYSVIFLVPMVCLNLRRLSLQRGSFQEEPVNEVKDRLSFKTRRKFNDTQQRKQMQAKYIKPG